jgi:virginiamycin B lyase
MRRATLPVLVIALLALPAGAGLARGHTARPSRPHVSGPRKTTNQSPVYRFSAREPGVRPAAIHFRCAVDSPDLQACPHRYHAHLAVGAHTLSVQAVDRKGRQSRVAHVHVTVTQPLPPGGKIVATIHLPARADPAWIAADANNVWVHNPGNVVRVSPASNTIAALIPTPPIDYGYLASGAGAVWQAYFGDNSLLRIDPSTNKVVATIPLGDGAAPEGVAIADGAVWVAEHHQGAVVRIDPATNTVVATVDVGPTGADGPLEMTAGATGIWVNVPNENRVVHIDPATNSVVGFVGESGQPIVDGTSVWVETSTGLDRIDPTTEQVTAHVALPGPNAWGAAGMGSVWVTTAEGLARVDEATNKLIGLLPDVMINADIAVTADSVWLTYYGDNRLVRVQPVG